MDQVLTKPKPFSAVLRGAAGVGRLCVTLRYSSKAQVLSQRAAEGATLRRCRKGPQVNKVSRSWILFAASVFALRTSPRQVARDCRVTLVCLDAPRNDTAASSCAPPLSSRA